MINSLSPEDELQLQRSIQQSLQEIALQMGQPIHQHIAQELYASAVTLLSHVVYEPITLARLAGTLLVYQVQDTEEGEVEWFRAQIEQCGSADEVEELIESLHRVDSL